jgi:hypothetical protein
VLTGYFMGNYTIWLASVKKKLVPFWEIREEDRTHALKIGAHIILAGRSRCFPWMCKT